ncbi:MAG TPA: DUF3488 and transglutaminase-like domain-containing protein [Bacteriovoracaceae bacterium]|nr:DUF3488 and transglutaminase-like domain-containing protein [Bacteriovoracaceae bacterium]
MLDKNLKQNLVLLTFTLLMFDVLTFTTLGLVLLGVAFSFSGVKPRKLTRNALAILIFISYWIIYGKIIDPEVGLNFLTSIIVLKILEKDSLRDRYMVFFGLLLLISAGSLFEKSLTYVIFFGLSFLVLLKDFYSFLGQKLRTKDLGYLLLWIFPLTLAMFFFIPRMLNPIPFKNLSSSEGEVGYTTSVNVSGIESLQSNTDPVFQALVSRPVNQNELYWKGNTVSVNDGWNWNLFYLDRVEGKPLLGVGRGPTDFSQTIRMYEKTDFFFALDHPKALINGKSIRGYTDTETMAQVRGSWVPRYEVVSQGSSPQDQLERSKNYLQVQVSPETKEWIHQTFSSTSLEILRAEVTDYFDRENFIYSLTPGRSSDFEDFMRVKKIGFCSHFASALGIILRTKGIPARLVSGFMGGSYNKFGSYYLISQNDAHVWVEAYSKGSWKRLDPTAWIAPDRVRLGGEAFNQELIARGQSRVRSLFKLPAFFNSFKQWFGQWDFSFYQWLEQMDYHGQEAWFTRLRFKREWLFSLLPLLMVSFMGIYLWYLKHRSTSAAGSELTRVWRSFYSQIKDKGLELSTTSLLEAQAQLEQMNHLEKEKYLRIWRELVLASFGQREELLEGLKKQIRKL